MTGAVESCADRPSCLIVICRLTPGGTMLSKAVANKRLSLLLCFYLRRVAHRMS